MEQDALRLRRLTDMSRPIADINFMTIRTSLSAWEKRNSKAMTIVILPLVTLPCGVSAQLLLINRNIWKRRHPAVRRCTQPSDSLRPLSSYRCQYNCISLSGSSNIYRTVADMKTAWTRAALQCMSRYSTDHNLGTVMFGNRPFQFTQ
jgi:hypothetical protein